MFTWSDRQQPVVLTNTEGVQSVDWNGVMDEKLLKFRAEIDLQSNKEVNIKEWPVAPTYSDELYQRGSVYFQVSVQRQKYTDLEVAVIALSKDVDDLKGKLSSLSLLAHEVEELKRRLEALQSEMRSRPNYKDAITSLQQDLHRLQLRLGVMLSLLSHTELLLRTPTRRSYLPLPLQEVNLEDKDDQSSGVLLYLYNEINNVSVYDRLSRLLLSLVVCFNSWWTFKACRHHQIRAGAHWYRACGTHDLICCMYLGSYVMTDLSSNFDLLCWSITYRPRVYLLVSTWQLRAAMQTTPTAPPPPQPCPDSSCACESELSLRLETLRGNLMSEIESKVGTGATVFLNSDNSSGLSEQVGLQLLRVSRWPLAACRLWRHEIQLDVLPTGVSPFPSALLPSAVILLISLTFFTSVSLCSCSVVELSQSSNSGWRWVYLFQPEMLV